MSLFNPNPKIELVSFDQYHRCFVIDDALADPHGVRDSVIAQRSAFRPVDFNAYPGNYLMATADQVSAMQSFFLESLRRCFDARRLLQLHLRFSMVTMSADALRPYQWLCHADSMGVAPNQSIQACVLYLFEDETLGGTGFYRPNKPPERMSYLFRDALALSGEAFSARYGIQRGYMRYSNEYFTRVGGIPAKWNRLIFYDGSMFHSGDIDSPEKLTDDPASGRLTLNGFFTSSRKAV